MLVHLTAMIRGYLKDGFVNSVAIAKSGHSIVAGVGQVPSLALEDGNVFDRLKM
uniref:Uncharacterized protein n=1 Tax=Arundo donax TaxID=35708 RepID=A0A0A9FH81_ARUDO